MAAKIVLDSFRTLSLNLTESVDHDFFDDTPRVNDTANENSSEQVRYNAPSNPRERRTPESCECAGPPRQVEDDSSISLTHRNSSEHGSRYSKLKPPCSAPSSNAVSYESDFSDTVLSTELSHPAAPNDEADALTASQSCVDTKEETAGNILDDNMNGKSVAAGSLQGHVTSRKNDLDTEHCLTNCTETGDRRAKRQLEVVRELSRQLRAMRIRPPWRDPNSKPLPSDHAVSLYELYEQFSNSAVTTNDLSRLFNMGEVAVCRPYHATLNRQRQLEKIQMENYHLAKRLQNIRPSPGMTRAEQLREYKRYFIPSTCFSGKILALPRRPETSASSVESDLATNHNSIHPKWQPHTARQSGSAQAYCRWSSILTTERSPTSSGVLSEGDRTRYLRQLKKMTRPAAVGSRAPAAKQKRHSSSLTTDDCLTIRCVTDLQQTNRPTSQKVPGHPSPPPPSPVGARRCDSSNHRVSLKAVK